MGLWNGLVNCEMSLYEWVCRGEMVVAEGWGLYKRTVNVVGVGVIVGVGMIVCSCVEWLFKAGIELKFCKKMFFLTLLLTIDCLTFNVLHLIVIFFTLYFFRTQRKKNLNRIQDNVTFWICFWSVFVLERFCEWNVLNIEEINMDRRRFPKKNMENAWEKIQILRVSQNFERRVKRIC